MNKTVKVELLETSNDDLRIFVGTIFDAETRTPDYGFGLIITQKHLDELSDRGMRDHMMYLNMKYWITQKKVKVIGCRNLKVYYE